MESNLSEKSAGRGCAQTSKIRASNCRKVWGVNDSGKSVMVFD